MVRIGSRVGVRSRKRHEIVAYCLSSGLLLGSGRGMAHVGSKERLEGGPRMLVIFAGGWNWCSYGGRGRGGRSRSRHLVLGSLLLLLLFILRRWHAAKVSEQLIGVEEPPKGFFLLWVHTGRRGGVTRNGIESLKVLGKVGEHGCW